MDTIYDFKSLIFAGNFSNFPVLQSNCAPCQPQMTVEPSRLPSDRLAPMWVQVSSSA